jgi:hypothetical protein
MNSRHTLAVLFSGSPANGRAVSALHKPVSSCYSSSHFINGKTVNMKNFTMQYSSSSRLTVSVLSVFLSFFVFLGASSANTPTGVSSSVLLTGTTYYVNDATGNDNNPGTLALPFKTIQIAILEASSGDAIQVASGTYTGPITVNKKLDINGDGIGSTIVQASGGTAFTYMAAGSGSGARRRADHHVCLSRVPRENHRPGGQAEVVQGGRLTTGEGSHAVDERIRQNARDDVTRETAPRRLRQVRRELYR